MLWDWGWTWQNVDISNAKVGLRMTGDYRGGSTILLDSKITDTETALLIDTPKGIKDTEDFSITLQGVDIENVGVTLHHQSSGTDLGGGVNRYASWVWGTVYDAENPNGQYLHGHELDDHPEREGFMFDQKTGKYFTRWEDEHPDWKADRFMSARILAKGDGETDDTRNLNMILDTAASEGRPVFFPFGSYIVTDTIHVPKGSVLIGECWSQIVAQGPNFQDAENPRPVLKVAEEGEMGSMEIQDLMITVQGPTAGATLMEWNIAQDKQGSAAMWDTHFRVGGAQGSQLTAKDCPKLTGKLNPSCIAASMLLHMKGSSNGYLENVWAWVADHDLDSGPDQTQIDVYSARGMLIESKTGATWLYGTSSEHSVFYQYSLVGAKKVFLGMIQTESPYYLPKPQAPAPFDKSAGIFLGDPDFSDCSNDNIHCAAAWGVQVIGSTDVHIMGAGLYNWFQDYTQQCVDTQDCQQRVMKIAYSGQVWLYNLYTIGTAEMLNYGDDEKVLAKDHNNMNAHPYTAILNAWMLAHDGEGSGSDGAEVWVAEEEPDDLTHCGAFYSDLNTLIKDAPKIDIFCLSKYTSQALYQMMVQPLLTYENELMNDWSAKYDTYHKVVKRQVPLQIKQYLTDEANIRDGAFHCTETVYNYCCNGCGDPDSPFNCPPSNQCTNGNSLRSLGLVGRGRGLTIRKELAQCDSGTREVNRACPHRLDDTIVDGPQGSFRYVIDDQDKFWKDMDKKAGVTKDWIVFQNWQRYPDSSCSDNCTGKGGSWTYNMPTLKDDFNLPDPSKIIGAAHDRMWDLAGKATTMSRLASAGIGYEGAVADALLVPALMMTAAADEMKKIVKIVHEEEQRERQEFIGGLLGLLMFIVPILGEAAAGISASFRVFINLAGELGNTAFTAYQIADDPTNAAATLLGALLGGFGVAGGAFSESAFARTSKELSEMRISKIDELPAVLKDGIHAERRLIAACGLRG